MSSTSNLSTSTRATGELINVIKEIYYNTSGENTDERDRIIKKVDQQFGECDARVDKYIRTSSNDLSKLIKLFNEMARKIETSRANVLSSREALKQCKLLLQSKRDDVRRLWLDWCEQKYYYANLARLKSINNTTEVVNQMCAEKRYVDAAHVIADCTLQLQTDFADLGALKDFNTVLAASRIKLEGHLLDELNFQFYDSVTKSVLETGGSGMSSGGNSTSMSKRRLFKPDLSTSFGDSANNTSWRSNTSTIIGMVSGVGGGDDVGPVDPPLTSEQMIDQLVSAAGQLTTPDQLMSVNILEKLVEEINRDLTSRLIKMVNVTSTHVVESNLINRTTLVGIENNPKFLGQLIELTFEQFKCMARLYRHFIESAMNKLSALSISAKYQWAHVWTCIQNVLMQLLDEYLDIRQLNQSQSSAEMLDKFDINSFFVRKRLINLAFGDSAPQATGDSGADTDEKDHHRIFTFKGSSHAMSVSNYIREQNNENLFSNADSNNGESSAAAAASSEQRTFKILVCQPNNRNITAIFGVTEHIVKDIADELRSRDSGVVVTQQSSTHSGQSTTTTTATTQQQDMIFEKFLQDFILNTFVQNAVSSITQNAQINSSIDGKYEISKQLISLPKQRELGLQRPILQSVLLVYESCMELFSLIKDMSSYGAEFTRAMHSLIERHLEYVNKLFRSIVTTNSTGSNGDSYVYSMAWVQDEGIKKYFKQLPSFSLAIKGKPSLSATITSARMALSRNYFLTGVINSANTITSNMNSQNPAVLAARVEVEQFNIEILSKEVETLLANLSDHELEDVDIIKNFNYIELIAQLHESSDWLIVQLKGIIGALEQMVKNPKSLNSSLSLNETNRLTKLVDELEKWRGDTLLLLYLETRVHCFYHLMSFIKQENNTSYAGDLDTDPDETVLHMNRDLHRIYEHLSRSLQEHKCAYVFEALGFMIASIFVRAIKNFKKISTHGIAKMCRNIFNVEQNLSAIRQISDPHLMKAHRFYELLYKKPEELLNHLIEHEAEFSLNDYINLLNLIYRSQPGYEINSLSDNIESLKNILKNKQH